MGLSCSYDTDYDWYYTHPKISEFDFSQLNTNRSKRCCSCNMLIKIGNDCLVFSCHRDAKTEIEERIYGDEVPLADKYLCVECGEIFLNLTDIGYCLTLGFDLHDDLRDYWIITGFDKEKYLGDIGNGST